MVLRPASDRTRTFSCNFSGDCFVFTAPWQRHWGHSATGCGPPPRRAPHIDRFTLGAQGFDSENAESARRSPFEKLAPGHGRPRAPRTEPVL